MNQGAKRLQELFPDRGAVVRLATEMGVGWPVASRWRSGEFKPVTRFRVQFQERYGIALLAWDELVVVEVPTPTVTEEVSPESEPETVEPEPKPRLVRSLRSLVALQAEELDHASG